MRTIEAARSALLVIDLQARLMPAIEGGPAVLAATRRLLRAAALLDVSVAITEQNPAGLGPTVPGLEGPAPIAKTSFDACRDGGLARLPDRPCMVLAGAEAHVCVLQTALGLLEAGRQVFVVADAVGSRTTLSHTTALRRLERHGAEIVTSEMVLFEWLGTATHPKFREVLALLK